jgi:hypothetical protein
MIRRILTFIGDLIGVAAIFANLWIAMLIGHGLGAL